MEQKTANHSIQADTSVDTSSQPLQSTLEPETAALSETDLTNGVTETVTDLAKKPKRPVVLVVHASVGSGHRSAAQAIGQALELLRDNPVGTAQQNAPISSDLDVRVLDILDYGRRDFDGDATASMFTGTTRPIYDLTWRYTFTGRLLWGGGTIWSHIAFPEFSTYVKEVNPIAIICTHITSANVAIGARILTGYDFPIICVPTDYEVEGLWPHRYTDLFCVANEYMAETLRARKVPDERIRITGIPTRLAFHREYDRNEIRRELNLPNDRTLVLILAGAHLPRPYIRFRETIDQLLPFLHTFKGAHFAILAGKDDEYARHLRKLVAGYSLENVTVFDYIENVAPLMAASDLTICKAGGLTVTECLSTRTPMILMGRAYGQEKANVRMLTAAGAALHVTTFRELMSTLHHVIERPESMQAMLVNASFLRCPHAAMDIACSALDLAGRGPGDNQKLPRNRLFNLFWGHKPAHIR